MEIANKPIMNYTDRFFEFPGRIYDRFATQQAMEQEEKDNIPIEGDWAAGRIKIPFQEISSWSDYFDSDQGVEGVKEKGFEYTLIWTHNEGTYISIWKKDKFEQKLNEYVTKFEDWAKDKIDFHIHEIARLDEIKVQ